MSQALSALRSDTNGELLQVKWTIESISNDLHERNDTLIMDTKKEIDSISLEGNAQSKSLLEEMRKYKRLKRVEEREEVFQQIYGRGIYRSRCMATLGSQW
jgi:uncharacterized protein with ACT and thioredoxin-like domain